MGKPRTAHRDSLLVLEAKQGTIGRRLKAFSRLDELDVILKKILDAHSKAGTCETCGRFLNVTEQTLILKAVRETRENIKTQISVVKDLFLVYRNAEFQRVVTELMAETDPKLREDFLKRLRERRATAAEVFGSGHSETGIGIS